MFGNISEKHLGVLRFTVFGLWFVIILFSPITSYAYLPDEIFKPLGIYRLFFWAFDTPLREILFSSTFLLFLKGALLTGTLLCAIGARPFRAIAVPTIILLFTADMITKGFNGFINHAELGLLYSSLVLVLFPAADGFSISKDQNKNFSDETKHKYILPVFIISVTICLAYSFVGVHRVLFGGFEQFFNNALNMHLIINSLNYTKYGMDWGLIITGSKPLLIIFKTGFLIITLFEIATPLILLNRKFRLIWLTVMIPFHLFSLLTMKIFFWENSVLLLVLFVVVGEFMQKEK